MSFFKNIFKAISTTAKPMVASAKSFIVEKAGEKVASAKSLTFEKAFEKAGEMVASAKSFTFEKAFEKAGEATKWIGDKLTDWITGFNSKKIDSTVALAKEIDVNIPNLTNLNRETATKQVSTNDKKSFEKVSEILNNKNDSSFDYQKVAKIIDSSSLSSSVKGQFNKNLGYNQYQKMQDLVSNQEQVSRYQEIEQQAIENKILDQQPTEEQVINHQISELQYQ